MPREEKSSALEELAFGIEHFERHGAHGRMKIFTVVRE